MRWTTTLLYTALAVFAAAPCRAGSPRGLERLAWLAGSWAADSAGTRSEEHWTAPLGGLMTGMHRGVRAGRAAAFEFLRIAERGDTLVYLAQPSGRPPVAFAADSVGVTYVRFTNPAHDFPQRILYWLDAEGTLHARVEGAPRGRPASENHRWRRGALAP